MSAHYESSIEKNLCNPPGHETVICSSPITHLTTPSPSLLVSDDPVDELLVIDRKTSASGFG